ncbi:vegetatible incompatibility het-E-1 [Fusarium mexicanum]|uniref:Vegetatible incompatibility het-E-1 n=1 Tax=Fusarium mexicanum TaxID=751941 RepID=A0A8H5IZA5_9HYPO|nr:vegetatible incompatibility het-E-1 [Fusarium mexicanum]
MSLKLHILNLKSGHWVEESNTHYVDKSPFFDRFLAFSLDNEWLLTYHHYTSGFAIRKVTYPYTVQELGSLDAYAPPYSMPELEEPSWRTSTRFGVLAIGEPNDFRGTRRVGWGLAIEKDWIMRGNERMLWIPVDYRRMALDVPGSRLAFVCPSGQIKIMRFE